MEPTQQAHNIVPTSWRRVDVDTTSFWRHVTAGVDRIMDAQFLTELETPGS